MPSLSGEWVNNMDLRDASASKNLKSPKIADPPPLKETFSFKKNHELLALVQDIKEKVQSMVMEDASLQCSCWYQGHPRPVSAPPLHLPSVAASL